VGTTIDLETMVDSRLDQIPNGFSRDLPLRGAVGAAVRRGGGVGAAETEARAFADGSNDEGLEDDGEADGRANAGRLGDGGRDVTLGEGGAASAVAAAGDGDVRGQVATDGGDSARGVEEAGRRTTNVCAVAAAETGFEPRAASNNSCVAIPRSTSATASVDQAISDCRRFFPGSGRDCGCAS
jgi:hypothetical protein